MHAVVVCGPVAAGAGTPGERREPHRARRPRQADGRQREPGVTVRRASIVPVARCRRRLVDEVERADVVDVEQRRPRSASAPTGGGGSTSTVGGRRVVVGPHRRAAGRTRRARSPTRRRRSCRRSGSRVRRLPRRRIEPGRPGRRGGRRRRAARRAGRRAGRGGAGRRCGPRVRHCWPPVARSGPDRLVDGWDRGGSRRARLGRARAAP